jgi:hypothetical protein
LKGVERYPAKASRGGWSTPAAAAVLSGLVVLVPPALGQSGPAGGGRDEPPAWAGDLAFLGGNAALGGLAAGLVRALRGGSFWDAFPGGALGGALSYTGRRVAVETFPAAGLLGREVGAVGGSVVRNAANGAGLLDELVLPAVVARVYLRRGTAPWLRVELDAPTLLASIYLGLRGDAELDVGASASAGTPVFYTRERWAEGGWAGYQAAGAIWLRGNPGDPYPEVEEAAAFAHERVHVLQYDFSFLSWGEPVESLLAPYLPGGEWIGRHVELGLHLGAWGVANALLRYDERPWEAEAHFLSDVSHRR